LVQYLHDFEFEASRGTYFNFIPLATYEKTTFTIYAGRSFKNGFSAPKRFRDFRETGPWTLSLPKSLPVKYFASVLVFRIIIIRSWMIYALTNVNPCFGNAVMNLQTDRQPDKELDQKPCTLLVALNSYCLLARFSGPIVICAI